MSTVSSKVQQFAERLRPKKPWGIIGGATFGLFALMAPWFLLQPFLAWLIPRIRLSANSRLALVEAAVLPLCFAVLYLVIRAYGKTLRDIGFTKPLWRHALYALIGFVGYFAAAFALTFLALHFFGLNTNQVQNVGFERPDGMELVLVFIPVVIITPLLEESIFRGFMLSGFRRHMPFWLAAFSVSAIFGLVHGQWNVGLDVFAMSLVSCYLVKRTNSLWPSIFLHALKNGVAFCFLYLYTGH